MAVTVNLELICMKHLLLSIDRAQNLLHKIKKEEKRLAYIY